ncbi:hypothetical protein FRC09_010096 [Ceratobasidium sp. 395]|nr:hypothetical protein FRC09_010096 [Ceratobasidium sp. 395]
MSTPSASGLHLPNDEQTRSVILSYLIHHGHGDTARAFLTEVARREAAESVGNCPLWKKTQQSYNPGSPMELADNEAGAALGHASPEERNTDKHISTSKARPFANGKEPAQRHTTKVSEDVLEGVGVRRIIRKAILSGKIDEAIELITHHLPAFLPITSPDTSAPSPTHNLQPGSHDLPQTDLTLSSSDSPESFSSRATTPTEPTPEPVQSSEKVAQKVDAPTMDTSQTGSPKPTDARESSTPDGTPRGNNTSSLGRSVNPLHILLNLRVQQFLEAVRTVPLQPDLHERNGTPSVRSGEEHSETDPDVNMHAPGSPAARGDFGDPPESPLTLAASDAAGSMARQRHLFELASQLYQNVKGLKCSVDREIYEKEIEQVCSLMIGPCPEQSLAAPYLSMKRREALADQVNSSMLHFVGESPAPALQIWAQTTRVVWDQISAHVTLPRAPDIPADAKMYAHYVLRTPEGEEERTKAQAASFDFSALARA